MKKFFTLAEVLVTLAILGIVATMTIPNTVKRNYDKQYRTKFLKTYSALDHAFSQWAIETNYGNTHLGGNVATNMENMLRDRMQTTNEKVPVLSDNFIAKYNNNKGIKGLDGKDVGGMNVWRQGGLILRDGTQINMSCGHEHWVDTNFNGNFVGQYSCSFFVDVNGESKGPNVLGRDIYYLVGLHDGLYTYPLPEKYTSLYIPPGSTAKAARAERHITCNKRTSSGYGCSGWFMNHSDYEH